jgi:hypothetical protein
MGQRIAGLCVCARDGAWEPTENERGLYGGVQKKPLKAARYSAGATLSRTST